MNYFEFRDKYLNILFKLEDSANQISDHIYRNIHLLKKDKNKVYENYLLLNLIEFTHGKIQRLVGLLISATCSSYDMAMLEIVEMICRINCYLYSINDRVEKYAPQYTKNFNIMYHLYIEEAKYLFNKLEYIEAALLIISSDKLLWEKRAGDFCSIKTKSLSQTALLYSIRKDVDLN